MYGRYQGGGRPGESGLQRPLSTKTDAISISEIVRFAKEDAKATWDALQFGDIKIPRVAYGKTTKLADGSRAYSMIDIDRGNKITLNKELQKTWTTPQFAQAFLMEMGNLKNVKDLNAVWDNIDTYSDADSFARALELIEYGSFIIICRDSYSSTSPLKPSIWSGVPESFEQYLMSPRMKPHTDAYRAAWYEAKNLAVPDSDED